MRASYHQNVHMKIHVRREECIFYLLSLGFAAELLLSFWQIAKFISGQMDNLMNWFILFGWRRGVTDRHDIWIRFVGVVTYNGKNKNKTLSWGLSVFVLPLYQSMAFFVLLIIKQIVTNYVSIFLHSAQSMTVWSMLICDVGGWGHNNIKVSSKYNNKNKNVSIGAKQCHRKSSFYYSECIFTYPIFGQHLRPNYVPTLR